MLQNMSLIDDTISDTPKVDHTIVSACLTPVIATKCKYLSSLTLVLPSGQFDPIQCFTLLSPSGQYDPIQCLIHFSLVVISWYCNLHKHMWTMLVRFERGTESVQSGAARKCLRLYDCSLCTPLRLLHHLEKRKENILKYIHYLSTETNKPLHHLDSSYLHICPSSFA